MKKLLSLLSVLTISGTAVPTTIAASPYQKNEQITNNLENLKINKRNIPYSKFINGIQQIAQQQDYWCGPAVGGMILRYFGITSLSPLQSNQY